MAKRWFAGLAIATVGVFSAVAAAHAADAYEPGDTYLPVTPPAPVAYDFSGTYFGATVGGRWSDFDTVFGGAAAGADEVGGFSGGPIGGIAFQSDRIVYGFEADVNFTSGDTTTVVAGVPVTTENDWFGTLRGRVGYAFDSALVYGTGGLAVGDVGVSTPAGSDDETRFGWTIGAGLEVPIAENFTARAEYLYTDLGSSSGNIGGTPFNSEFDSHTVRAGVTYKFP